MHWELMQKLPGPFEHFQELVEHCVSQPVRSSQPDPELLEPDPLLLPALPEKLRAEVPGGLSSAREKVVAMLGDVETTMKPSRLVLGGFSQGAMLSCDVALRSDVRLDGVVLMSGTLIAEPEWTPLFPKRAGMPAFQSHGRDDALLPFSNAELLRDRMTQAGWNVSWVAFRGGHEIPGLALDGLSAFLGRTLV